MWFSIWRIRSRVTLNARPTSSSVRGRPRTLEEVGRAFNVTRERIRQIENHTLKKLESLPEAQRLRDAS